MLSRVLDDEALTRGLGDAEARVLVEWLVEQAEWVEVTRADEAADEEMRKLCRRGRALARFVDLWCHRGDRGAALQLAGAERFAWPLPEEAGVDACELMQAIVRWEAEQFRA